MVKSSQDTRKSPCRDEAVERLWKDLSSNSDSRLPEDSLKFVLDRIEAEPARVETDASGGIVATNPAFSALCGYSFSEIRGRKPGSFLQGPETDPAAVEVLRHGIAERKPVTAEMVNYHKNGTPYRVRISIEPIFHADGRLTGFRAVEVEL